MAFYVPVGGLRGLFIRFGSAWVALLGSCVYWSACWRRGLSPATVVVPVLDGLGDA